MAEEAVLLALRERNRAGKAACEITRSHERLLTAVKEAEVQARHCEQLREEAAAAKAAEVQAAQATRQMGEKLAEAQAKAADLQHTLKQITHISSLQRTCLMG